MYKVLFILLFTAFIWSCEKEPLGSNFFFIRHHKADMPVWVRGNLESGIFIIYLHGGPGGSSFIDIQNDFFSDIEDKHAVVYYDQRASGNSIGKSDNDLLTLDQFVEDLDVVVQYIQSNYQPAKTVLLGHSWGGTLGTAYLLKPEYQDKIDAWIEVDGGHNIGQGAFEYSRDYVVNVADSLIAKQEDIQGWKDIKAYYLEQPSWRPSEVIIQHSKNVTKAGGYFFDKSNQDGLVGLEQILFSETDFLALLAQNKHVIKHMDVWHYDFTDRLGEITIPTLLLWGKTDGILPVQLAHEAKEALKLTDDQFYIFQESAHSPHYEQTALFNEKVLSFLATYLD